MISVGLNDIKILLHHCLACFECLVARGLVCELPAGNVWCNLVLCNFAFSFFLFFCIYMKKYCSVPVSIKIACDSHKGVK